MIYSWAITNLEKFIWPETKTNKGLDESVSQLNTKFENLSTHQKIGRHN